MTVFLCLYMLVKLYIATVTAWKTKCSSLKAMVPRNSLSKRCSKLFCKYCIRGVNLWYSQACPWECRSYGNPLGNVPWDGTGI